MEFLLEVDQLRELGDTLGAKYGATSAREKILAACQLVHDFDWVFGHYKKKELWARYVLPQTLWRYDHDRVIVNPSDVQHFGRG
jgi:hypothetical protein